MSTKRSMVIVIVLIPAAIALALWAFIWPNARLEPRDLPLGVAGETQATAPLKAGLAERDGAFDVKSYDDENEARTAIEEREVYGAIVVTEAGPELLTASAASPAVAQLLTEAVGEQAGEGHTVPVKDVVAAPAEDPRGSALNSSVLPLALAAVAVGSAVAALGLRGTRAVAALVGASTVIGLAAAGISDSWLGVVNGNWWAEAGAYALTVLAGGAAVAGISALIGTAGIGVGALLVVLFGNPFSGVTSAPEMLPQGIGVIGQLLPPGAGGSLLRSVAFFDGNAAAVPALTLGIWTLVGLALVWLGALRSRHGAARDEGVTEIRTTTSVA